MSQNARFFVHLSQRQGYEPAVFLDGYFTYFWYEVGYNGFADEEKTPLPSHERQNKQGA